MVRLTALAEFFNLHLWLPPKLGTSMQAISTVTRELGDAGLSDHWVWLFMWANITDVRTNNPNLCEAE